MTKTIKDRKAEGSADENDPQTRLFGYELRFRSSMLLGEPDVDNGIVVPAEADLVELGDDSEEEEKSIGAFKYLLFHAGLGLNLGQSLWEAADAESHEAMVIADTFFRDNQLKPPYEGGATSGILLCLVDWPEDLPIDLFYAAVQRIDDHHEPEVMVVAEGPEGIKLRLDQFGFEAAKAPDTSLRCFWWRTCELQHPRPGVARS